MSEATSLLLGLSAAIAWGVPDVLGAVSARRIGSLRTTALANAAAVVTLAALAMISGTALPGDPAVVLGSLACGVIGAFAFLAFYSALRLGPLSVVSPVVSMYGGLTVILSVWLLGERLSPTQAIGAVTATIGIALVGVVFERDWRRTRLVGRGVLFALVALVGFGVTTVILSGPIRAAGWLPVLLLARASNTAIVWSILGLRTALRIAPDPGTPDAIPLTRRNATLAAVVGSLDVGGAALWSYGLQVAWSGSSG